MNPTDIHRKMRSGVMAAFAADALALGVHWVYDVSRIKKRYGRLDHLTAPEIALFHKNRQKGDFTHYGDQMLVLLASLSHCNGFDADDFAARWQALFDHYKGYLDGATQKTLAGFQAGRSPSEAGSDSTDLGGAARMVPLALFYAHNADSFMDYAQHQTAMTHNHPLVLDTARFFAQAALETAKGTGPAAAIRSAAEHLPAGSPVPSLVDKGLASAEKETTQAISGFGQACDTTQALPGTIHLIARYPEDLETALIENIMAGGDSSARGILCGFILGIHNGLDAVPQNWLKEMTAFNQIKTLTGGM
ncbi:ADP-ribosylglycohydrolase family protein [Desulfotignum balticum]|uniref:ADP-ribosylglycohydrolase family protein n=1 Tax=Desulfotignum balticum TaxID=115781 RepID=UPI0003F89D11|nr:ADP-ribosylglycohydrolase family protein [Desulfotignum balticum]